MNIPTAGPPADTATLREQIVIAREALSAATASLDGAMEAVGRDLPVNHLVHELCSALAATRRAGEWCDMAETVLKLTESR